MLPSLDRTGYPSWRGRGTAPPNSPLIETEMVVVADPSPLSPDRVTVEGMEKREILELINKLWYFFAHGQDKAPLDQRIPALLTLADIFSNEIRKDPECFSKGSSEHSPVHAVQNKFKHIAGNEEYHELTKNVLWKVHNAETDEKIQSKLRKLIAQLKIRRPW